MSIADAAASNVGAAATAQASKKRQTLLKVNGKVYTRLDCLGRGGSGKVYRVAAENGKMYALKRVSVENADEHTVKGFKGEIDLLKKLSDVERVIQLIDYEMNEEKQMLSMVGLRGVVGHAVYRHPQQVLTMPFRRSWRWASWTLTVCSAFTRAPKAQSLTPSSSDTTGRRCWTVCQPCTLGILYTAT
jgi:serine/threonine protein kinase